MTVRRSFAPSSSRSTPVLLPILIVRGLDPADDIPEALPLLRAVIRECHRFLIDHPDPSVVYADRTHYRQARSVDGLVPVDDRRDWTPDADSFGWLNRRRPSGSNSK